MGTFGPRERMMLAGLLTVHPKPVKISDFITQFYADDEDGGPLTADKVIHQVAHHLRGALGEFGWKLITKGSRMHLIMSEEERPLMLSAQQQSIYDVIKQYQNLRVHEIAKKLDGENIKDLPAVLVHLRKKLDAFGKERLTNVHHRYAIVKQRSGMQPG